MKTERLVPVDSFVCQLVQRLRLLRSLDPTPADGFLLARPRGREMLLRGLRKSLHDITAAAGIAVRIVPHQLRHTYATFMLRAGISFPGMMKLLGHSSPDMTMRYLGVVLPDLQREYQQARSQRVTWYLNRSNQTQHAPIYQGWSKHSRLHNTSWRCFAARCRRALPAAAWVALPTASPRWFAMRVRSKHQTNRQRSAG
jgi:hypothetical protein